MSHLAVCCWGDGGGRGLTQHICDKNVFLNHFELVPKSWKKTSADVKADVRQQEIKELVISYIL